jgi:hypothetical protein
MLSAIGNVHRLIDEGLRRSAVIPIQMIGAPQTFLLK